MQPILIATLRAVAGGLVMGGAAFFGQLASGGSSKTGLIAGGVAFFGYLVLRGGVEGVIDQNATGQPKLPVS